MRIGTSRSCSSFVILDRRLRRSTSCWKSFELSRKGLKHSALQPHFPSTLRRRRVGNENLLALTAICFRFNPLAIPRRLQAWAGGALAQGSSSLRTVTSCMILKRTVVKLQKVFGKSIKTYLQKNAARVVELLALFFCELQKLVNNQTEALS